MKRLKKILILFFCVRKKKTSSSRYTFELPRRGPRGSLYGGVCLFFFSIRASQSTVFLLYSLTMIPCLSNIPVKSHWRVPLHTRKPFARNITELVSRCANKGKKTRHCLVLSRPSHTTLYNICRKKTRLFFGFCIACTT